MACRPMLPLMTLSILANVESLRPKNEQIHQDENKKMVALVVNLLCNVVRLVLRLGAIFVSK
jgi:hypothetical protein